MDCKNNCANMEGIKVFSVNELAAKFLLWISKQDQKEVRTVENWLKEFEIDAI